MSDPVDVVIVSHNSEHVMDPLLDSLPAAFGPVRYRTVVVDNGSTDNTRQVVARRGEVLLVRSSNVGYAAGINRGVRELRGSGPILVLNPDVRLRPRSAQTLVESLVDSKAGVVGPRIEDADGSLVLSMRREPTLRRALGVGRGLATWSEYVREHDAYEREQVVDWLLGAALLIDRACFTACGGWDESYFLYSEETDFCLRAKQRGWDTRFIPSATVVHIGAQSGTSDTLHAMQIYNRVRFFGRRHGRVATAAYLLVAVLSETSWWLRGHRQSLAALRALVHRPSRPPELRSPPAFLPR